MVSKVSQLADISLKLKVCNFVKEANSSAERVPNGLLLILSVTKLSSPQNAFESIPVDFVLRYGQIIQPGEPLKTAIR